MGTKDVSEQDKDLSQTASEFVDELGDEIKEEIKNTPEYKKFQKAKSTYSQLKKIADDPSAYASRAKNDPIAALEDSVTASEKLGFNVKNTPEYKKFQKAKAVQGRLKELKKDPKAFIMNHPDSKNLQTSYKDAKTLHKVAKGFISNPKSIIKEFDNPVKIYVNYKKAQAMYQRNKKTVKQITKTYKKAKGIYKGLKGKKTRSAAMMQLGSAGVGFLMRSKATPPPPPPPPVLPPPIAKRIPVDYTQASSVEDLDDLSYTITGIKATSDAWEGELEVLEMEGKAGISELYEYSILVHTADIIEVAGQGVNILGEEFGIVIHGFITSVKASYIGSLLVCRVIISSPLHKLRFSGVNRIFEELTPLEAITQILDDNEIDYEDLSELDLETKPYTVQYQQTDLEFLLTQFARSGLMFSFLHEEDQVTLQIIDSLDQLDLEAEETFCFDEIDRDSEYAVQGCEFIDRTVVDGYSSQFYDFESAEDRNPIEVGDPAFLSFNTKQVNGFMSEEVLENYLIANRLKKKSLVLKMRKFLYPGTALSYMILQDETSYYAMNFKYKFGFKEGLSIYALEVEADLVPDDADIRVIPKGAKTRRISGAQLGFVVGYPKEEFHADEWGRVRVRFTWDRYYLEDKGSTEDTCWVRVAQQGAGTVGKYYTPRVGDEVMVIFENGDPEKPLVVGSLYNSKNAIDHDPSSEDITYWKMKVKNDTDPTKAITGDGAVFNEISMNGLDGLFYMNAAKSMEIETKNNFSHTLTAGNYSIDNTLGNYLLTLVAGNVQTSVMKGEVGYDIGMGEYSVDVTKGNVKFTAKAGNFETEILKGNQKTTILKGSTETTLTAGSQKLTIAKGDQEATVGGNHKTTVMQKHSVTVTGNSSQEVLKNHTINVGQNAKLTVNAGGYTIQVNGGTLSIKSMSTILLKAPNITCAADANLTLTGANVNIKGKAAVNIQAPQVKCNAAGVLDMKAGGSAKVEGAALQLKGAMIKLN